MRRGDDRAYGQATRPAPVLPPAGPDHTPRARPTAYDANWTPGGCSPAIFLVAFLVLLLLAGAGLANQRRSQAGVVTAPAAGVTAPPAAPAPGPVVFVVGNTGGDGVYLRKTPNMADRDRAYADGTRLEQIGPDVTADALVWHNVRAPDGRTGWVPARYTVPAP